MESPHKERFEALLDWAHKHGASLHPLLEVYEDEVTGFSLRVKPSATELLGSGFKAVSCPTSITLSYLNALTDGPITPSSTTLAPNTENPAFPERFMNSLPPHVIGRFYLIQQYLKGKSSFWAPYISTLADPSQLDKWALPPFWAEDDIELLKGTNAYVAIQEIQSNVKSEYKQARKILKKEGFPDYRDYTQVLYNWAYCMFTSRSFRPSLVLSESAREYVERLLPEGSKIDDFSILQPLYDIGNHSWDASYTWNLTSEPSACELICNDSYGPGQQVFNNYGFKTNSELLLGYGFIINPKDLSAGVKNQETWRPHNDYIHVRKRQHQGDTQGKGGEPQDFLICREDFWEGYSCRNRMGSDFVPNALHYQPHFSHWDGRLINDMVSMMATPKQWELFKKLPDHSLGDGSLGEELDPLVDMLKATLAQKIERDFVEFCYGRPNGGEEWEPETERQDLVRRYRDGYEMVFVNVLKAFKYSEEQIMALKAAAQEEVGDEEEDEEMEDGN
ncbi:hypothetical protein NEUTE1DRAFT_147775 [Neurospora tetrasperma FGSC 2508]|uniref:SET domain-containing protein n=1 Tax=Neurospora tetrasperma (strain FGSC 2508 / ATCC MYA-4615 / P0657) TaxID=510951 RepID=F8MT60_NEUT8|nr:uncharacterized protein NEUTE1DRAFT_147775 [Neurospora tetrasperma FGSC 2508]EGO55192.1 hypothetical protein NEUTE1DRAFT_147775 [Neurospora tetrasperma FGSC 2508]EGZ69591.1 SET domain-containing protein [Neurospora tetrasperma FGSC 2509]